MELGLKGERHSGTQKSRWVIFVYLAFIFIRRPHHHKCVFGRVKIRHNQFSQNTKSNWIKQKWCVSYCVAGIINGDNDATKSSSEVSSSKYRHRSLESRTEKWFSRINRRFYWTLFFYGDDGGMRNSSLNHFWDTRISRSGSIWTCKNRLLNESHRHWRAYPGKQNTTGYSTQLNITHLTSFPFLSICLTKNWYRNRLLSSRILVLLLWLVFCRLFVMHSSMGQYLFGCEWNLKLSTWVWGWTITTFWHDETWTIHTTTTIARATYAKTRCHLGLGQRRR